MQMGVYGARKVWHQLSPATKQWTSPLHSSERLIANLRIYMGYNKKTKNPCGARRRRRSLDPAQPCQHGKVNRSFKRHSQSAWVSDFTFSVIDLAVGMVLFAFSHRCLSPAKS